MKGSDIVNIRPKKVVLRATAKDSGPNIRKQPFEKPKENDVLEYHLGRPMISYNAYLVEAELKADRRTLTIRGIDTEKLQTAQESYDVDLLDRSSIWTHPPATALSSLSPEKNCLIVLLSDDYVKGQSGNDKPTLMAAIAEDGGKWPKSAAARFIELEGRVREYYASLTDDEKKRFEEFFAEYLT